MRILFVSNNYTPYSGGVVSSIKATIDELQKEGHEVLLITLSFLNRHDDPAWVHRIPSLFRFRFRQNYMAIPWRPSFYIKQWITAFKPDVIHIHHPFLLGPIAVRIARTMHIKTMFTYHTIYQAYAYYVPLPQWLVQRIITWRVLLFCRNIDHIIAPSRGIKDYLQTGNIEKTTTLASGLPPFFLSQPFLAKKLEKPYQLLYVGRFVKEKNIPLLFEVMAQLPAEYQLTLVGYGEYTQYLQRYAYDFRHLSSDRIHFIIQPDKKRLLTFYQKAHLFLFPSQTDTQGIVLAEAMAASTPVIAMEGWGQADIICHGENGFMVENEGEMVRMIKTVVQDPDVYRRLQNGAYTTAQRYTSASLVKELISLYQS